ncbi:MAG: hypothetical protein Kow00127_05940 [Bacteroidales bacterium]
MNSSQLNITEEQRQLRGWLLVAVGVVMLLLTPALAGAQGFMGKNQVFVIGQILSKQNGAPLKGHPVTITADTSFESGFQYQKILFTDRDGFYYDTIISPLIKGALKVSTKDYLNHIYDTTLYYRFTWSEDNWLFANFAILTKPQAINYQANFYMVQNPNGNNEEEYQFVDNTNSSNVISWHWNFGDGATSTEQNPVHLFPGPGLYKITLTTEILPKPHQRPYLSTQVKVLNITSKDYFHLGGHVFAGYFPIDAGNAYLYKVENSQLIPIDTAIFSDSLGYYVFYQLIEGEYLVKSDLDSTSSLYNLFMPTYYGDKILWQNSETIIHDQSGFEYDIHLIPNEKSSSGPGTISGEIGFIDGGTENLLPAAGVCILLFNEDMVPVDITHSSLNGHFGLSSLESGAYYLYPEYTGKNTSPVYIEIGEQTGIISEVVLSIDQNQIYGYVNYAGIGELPAVLVLSEAYPNPASELVSIDLNFDAGYTIEPVLLDITGKNCNHQISWQLSGDRLKLDVSLLPPGIYWIKLNNRNSQAIKFIRR